ncbi:MAG TPA: uroporphyrinogen-III synthase [Gemmatimonadales bacterium]|jgi:uroporphyrinogen-III synthase|nr:uroporphyrinogen-III synthase [Gemmatimonadales bacterium]
MEKLVITASSGSFSGLADELRKISVQALERPLLSSQPPDDWARLDEALNHRDRYGSLALTSPRAAAAVAARIRACGISWVGHTPRVWAVGAATAEALQGALGSVQGSFPEASADLGAAERLAQVMLSAGAPGPVLFPCGENRRDELPGILRANGLVVDEVICYRMVLASAEQAREAVSGASMVLVASPSVLQLLVEACPAAARPALVAIGPTTAAVARSAGWQPAAVPTAPSTPALVSAIAGLLSPR